MYLEELRGRHSGRPAAVLGGAESLPADLAKIPPDAVIFAANHHAFPLVACAYCVYIDPPAAARILPGIIGISPRKDADIQVGSPTLPNFSGPLAAYAARIMDCAPVIICGMDLYQTGYFDGEALDPARRATSAKYGAKPWNWYVENAPSPHKIRAVSGPLAEIFGTYDPEEEIMSDGKLVTVTITEDRSVWLDKSRTMSFKKGRHKMTEEAAEAARKAGIVKESEKPVKEKKEPAEQDAR